MAFGLQNPAFNGLAPHSDYFFEVVLVSVGPGHGLITSTTLTTADVPCCTTTNPSPPRPR